MLLYIQSNEVGSGQISNGKSAQTQKNDLTWDKNDNILRKINGSFYVKVNSELYQKMYIKYLQKTYYYPDIYYLKCYYNNASSWMNIKRVTVNDCKIILIFN
jgi:hypothetical protein